MSIHDFHSKLMSGKEEGILFEALRRLKGIGSTVMAAQEEAAWSVWTESSTASGEEGWAVWEEEGSESMSRA